MSLLQKVININHVWLWHLKDVPENERELWERELRIQMYSDKLARGERIFEDGTYERDPVDEVRQRKQKRKGKDRTVVAASS